MYYHIEKLISLATYLSIFRQILTEIFLNCSEIQTRMFSLFLGVLFLATYSIALLGRVAIFGSSDLHGRSNFKKGGY